MWERDQGLGSIREDKEGIILLVVECQHGWIFLVMCVVVRQNRRVDWTVSLGLLKLNIAVKLNAFVANLIPNTSYSL